MCHIKRQIHYNIHHIYLSNKKHGGFLFDIFNFFDIMCNKNDDYIITFNLNMPRISIIYFYHYRIQKGFMLIEIKRTTKENCRNC